MHGGIETLIPGLGLELACEEPLGFICTLVLCMYVPSVQKLSELTSYSFQALYITRETIKRAELTESKRTTFLVVAAAIKQNTLEAHRLKNWLICLSFSKGWLPANGLWLQGSYPLHGKLEAVHSGNVV